MKRLWILGVMAACGGDSGSTADADLGPDADQVAEGPCQITGEAPDALDALVCRDDFDALAADPLDATLPGAQSGKVVLDRDAGGVLYFQNTERYAIHYEFVSANLTGVGSLAEFNATQYFAPDRRFLLGAVTYYEQPERWALELSPYDTASAEMIEALYLAVRHASYFGPELAFHPTSQALTLEAAELPASIPVVTTDELYAGIDYQPLSLGTAVGRLHITTAAAIETEYTSFQDIVILDEAPNDISVVQGIVTAEFQTPLSHINVLSRNRGTPNMGLRGATTDPALVALDGELVKLVVGANAWTIEPVTAQEAQDWWDAHAPTPVTLPALDLTRTELLAVEDVTPDPVGAETLRDVIRAAVPAYGGKTAHYSILARTDGVPTKPGFAVPIYYYRQFMATNGFDDQVTALLADGGFTTDAATRDAALADLRAQMMAAPLDPALVTALQDWVDDFPGATKLRFRSSSNSEDLDGFPCAGCYNSYSGEIAVPADLEEAIKHVYADVWQFRTFEERTYYGVAHDSVGMGLLVHTNFPDEEANGVAVTANPFDSTGLDPALYVNVQYGGDIEVVAPPPGVTSDQILYYYDQPNQPASYLAHSSLLPSGATVLSAAQLHELGDALDAIREVFSPAYGPASGNTGWYAMDVEFKFDDAAAPGETPVLYVKQARPYPDPFAATE